MKLRPPDPPLSDGVVALRLLREDDVLSMVSRCRDPEMQRWTLVPSPYGREDAYGWIERSRAQ